MSKTIDNSALLPKYRPHSEVTLEDSGNTLQSPDWVKGLIIEQLNVLTASADGTFSGLLPVLDHLAETGVNCVWLNPIHGGRHYYNYGPATVNPLMTGTEDVEESWKIVKQFVEEAHKRNIRVLFDIVTWGLNPEAPLIKEHPDWFKGWSEDFKGPLFNWKSTELFDWFSEQLVSIIRKTGADGYRADSSIIFCGHELYARVRRILHDEGIYIAIIGEGITVGTERYFDFNEHSVDYWVTREGLKFIEGEINFVSGYKPDMVSAVLEGKGLDHRMRQAYGEAGQLRFYSSIVSCHDSTFYIAQGRTAAIVYSSILSPFIPMWYIGEEWNNPYTGNEVTKWLYANKIDWAKKEENKEFFEKIKRSIRIRRLYPEIFENFPVNHREVNFCAVDCGNENALPAYARTADGYGIAVVANYSKESEQFKITIPYEALSIQEEQECVIIELMSGERIYFGKAGECKSIAREIAAGDVGVYGIAAVKNGAHPFEGLEEE